MRPKCWTTDCDAKLREYWSACYLKELADMLGCSANTIRAHATRLGLTKGNKSSYYNERRSETARKTALKEGKRPRPNAYGHKHTAETKKRIGEARHNLYASERRRLLYGLSQKTNIRVRY